MGIRKYVDDYAVVTDSDEKGREKKALKYQGEYFAVHFIQGDLVGYRLRVLISSMISLALHLGAGFINNAGMRQFFIAIPYVAAYLPFYYLAAGIFSMPKTTCSLQRHEADISFRRIRKTSRVLLVLLSVVALSELVFLLFNLQQGMPVKEVAFIVLMVLSAVVMARFVALQNKVTIIKMEK